LKKGIKKRRKEKREEVQLIKRISLPPVMPQFKMRLT
jgi:hypothetical protein